MKDTNVEQLNNWLKQRGVIAFLKARRIMNKKTGRYEYCLVRCFQDGSNELLTQYCTSNPNELMAVAENIINTQVLTESLNIRTARQANIWINKMGLGDRFYITSKNDRVFGKQYQVVENLPNGSRRVVYQVPDANICIDEVYRMFIQRR